MYILVKTCCILVRILSFWYVTYFIVKVASFGGHLFEGERSFFYVGGCYSLVLCEECFVGLVAISVIGTPFFGLIPTVTCEKEVYWAYYM